MTDTGPHLGPALPAVRGPLLAPLALALLCAVPIGAELRAAWWRGGPSDLDRTGSALTLLVFVVLPLVLARLVATYRIHVNEEAVTRVWRGRVRRTVCFDELCSRTSVRS